MDWRDVRPIAVGLPTRSEDDGDPTRRGEVLLSELYDPGPGEHFYRPVGGGLEFGEHSEDAVVREFREELSVTVTETEYLDTLERTFEFDGEPGHEIWFCYRVALGEDWPYEREAFTGREPEHDEEFPVGWLPVDGLADETVYPEELPELLEG